MSQIYPPSKKVRGFTLIEVLVASFILFLVIASITMVYRGAILSSSKAEQSLLFSSFVEPISEQIRFQIKVSENQNEIVGEGVMGVINYNWEAVIIQQSKAPEQLNLNTDELDRGDKTFKLWHVNLQLEIKNAKRNYEFNEVSW